MSVSPMTNGPKIGPPQVLDEALVWPRIGLDDGRKPVEERAAVWSRRVQSFGIRGHRETGHELAANDGKVPGTHV
jgi:hypothetical protein